MAHEFIRQANDGGDFDVWARFERAQNSIALSLNTAALYLDGSDLKLSKGNIGLDDDSQKGICVLDPITTFSIGALTASTWARVEISRTGTTVNLDITSIAAAASASALPTVEIAAYDGEKGGYYLTATKRIIGLVWINAGGDVEGIVNMFHGPHYSGYSISDDANDTRYTFTYSAIQATPEQYQIIPNLSPVYYTKSASFTVETFAPMQRRPRHQFFYCTGGNNGIRATVGTTGWQVGDRITFYREDFVAGTAVTIYASQLMSGMEYIILPFDRNTVTIERIPGNTWHVVSGTIIANSGWIRTSDWSNRHLGGMDIPYDNKSAGTILIGETITEATSGWKWVVVSYNATVLRCQLATGDGYATDGRQLTCSQSGVTMDVNSVPTTQNIDSNFYHGFSTSIDNIFTDVFFSNDKNEATARKIESVSLNASAGFVIRGVGTYNDMVVQTEANRVYNLDDAGAIETWDTENYYYKIVCKYTF